MRSCLVAASLLWPLLLAGGWAARVATPGSSVAAAIYMAAARVCHQRPDRSFETAGVAWPVCGRCAGLYAAAPIGALLAWRRRSAPPRRVTWILLLSASVPTVITLAAEWWGLLPVTTVARAAAATPLGCAIAAIVVAAASERPSLDQVH